jgi:hypothetical protein
MVTCEQVRKELSNLLEFCEALFERLRSDAASIASRIFNGIVGRSDGVAR